MGMLARTKFRTAVRRRHAASEPLHPAARRRRPAACLRSFRPLPPAHVANSHVLGYQNRYGRFVADHTSAPEAFRRHSRYAYVSTHTYGEAYLDSRTAYPGQWLSVPRLRQHKGTARDGGPVLLLPPLGRLHARLVASRAAADDGSTATPAEPTRQPSILRRRRTRCSAAPPTAVDCPRHASSSSLWPGLRTSGHGAAGVELYLYIRCPDCARRLSVVKEVPALALASDSGARYLFWRSGNAPHCSTVLAAAHHFSRPDARLRIWIATHRAGGTGQRRHPPR